MFNAYFDDSADSEGERVLVLAGCIHNLRTWADFSISWEAALARRPSIAYLHMREARMGIGEFKGWKKDERDAKVRSLAEVVAAYDPWVLSASVNRSDFDAILRPTVPFELRHAYFVLFYAAIIKLAQWHCEMKLPETVDFVFDEQGAMGAEAAVFYEYVKKIQQPEITAVLGGTPTFKNDKDILPLQAADLVAWHIRRRKSFPTEDESKLPTSAFHPSLYAEVHITKEQLAKIEANIASVPNVELFREHPNKRMK